MEQLQPPQPHPDLPDQPTVRSVDKPLYLQWALPASILVAALLISGTLWFSRSRNAAVGEIPGDNPDNQPVEITVAATDHILGVSSAPITIIEFSDFQCPFCWQFWSDSLSQLKKDYLDTGQARLVYKHYPLDFHPAAKPAARAVECAGAQGKFWELHDKIFQEQERLGNGTIQFTQTDIKRWAGQIGLAAEPFNTCVASTQYDQKIESDLNQGTQAGVSGTPTFFINGRRIVGAQPYSVFQAAIVAAD